MGSSFFELGVPVTAIYAAIFGILIVPAAMLVGARRAQQKIWFLDGGDETLLRRMRAHGNLMENVPFGLLLLALCELNGASAALLHSLGALLLAARATHFVSLLTNPEAFGRGVGALGTFAVFLIASGWLLFDSF